MTSSIKYTFDIFSEYDCARIILVKVSKNTTDKYSLNLSPNNFFTFITRYSLLSR